MITEILWLEYDQKVLANGEYFVMFNNGNISIQHYRSKIGWISENGFVTKLDCYDFPIARFSLIKAENWNKMVVD